MKNIVIVGGGFAGVETALLLSKKNLKNIHIRLISDKPHFEYHAALYKVVTGRSPLEVCIPLREIFKNSSVELLEDAIESVDPKSKKISGKSGSHYSYDFLVLALGSQTSYFGIPGLKEYSFGFKSISEALKLKRHLHIVCQDLLKANQDQKEAEARFVVVGGGASGVELSGELAVYLRNIFNKHKLDEKLLKIELIEAAPSILPSMPVYFREKVEKRLKDLNIDVMVDTSITKEEIDSIYLKNMQMKTMTVIWTAGVESNSLYKNISGFQFDKRGRVLVEDTLLAKGSDNIFVAGDAASIIYAGMAQSAVDHGKTISENISLALVSKEMKKIMPREPLYSIPVGPGWAGTLLGYFSFFGKTGWWLRRWVDLKYFLSILPLNKALAVFKNGRKISESCPICDESENELSDYTFLKS